MAEKERVQAAAGFRDQGNALYKEKRFLEAAVCYSRAIQADPSATATWTNRAAAYLELAKRTPKDAYASRLRHDVLRRAARDAAESTKMDASWEKGHLRLSAALEALGSPEASLWALTTGLQRLPGSKELAAKLEALRVKHPQAVASSREADRLLDGAVGSHKGHGDKERLEEEIQWLQAQIASQDCDTGGGAGGRENGSASSEMDRLKHAVEQTPAARDHPGRKHIYFGPMPPSVTRITNDSESDDGDDTEDCVMVRRPPGAVRKPASRNRVAGGSGSVPKKSASGNTPGHRQSTETVSDQGKPQQEEDGTMTSCTDAVTSESDGASTAMGSAAAATSGGSVGSPGILGRLASLFGSRVQAGAADAEAGRGGPGATSRNEGTLVAKGAKGGRENVAGKDRWAGSSTGVSHGSASSIEDNRTSTHDGGMPAGTSRNQLVDKMWWAEALGEDRMYEWLLDCYRFQESSMDATNVEFHSPLCGRLALLPFLLFCKLVHDRRVVPPSWSWRKFLAVSREDVWRKLSHDEALRRYGRMVMVQHPRDNSPNMIATTEHVYECKAGERMPEGTKDKLREVSTAFYEFMHGDETEIFDGIGGENAWRRLIEREPALVCKCTKSEWGKQFDPDYDNCADADEERWDSRWECKEDWANIGDGDMLLNR